MSIAIEHKPWGWGRTLYCTRSSERANSQQLPQKQLFRAIVLAGVWVPWRPGSPLMALPLLSPTLMLLEVSSCLEVFSPVEQVLNQCQTQGWCAGLMQMLPHILATCRAVLGHLSTAGDVLRGGPGLWVHQAWVVMPTLPVPAGEALATAAVH